MKRAMAFVGALAVVLSACASQGNTVGAAHTTSGDPNRNCLREQLDCVKNSDCCSFACVNAQCEREQP
jgi:hypothetical protein